MHTSCRGLRCEAISESLRSLGIAEGGDDNGAGAVWGPPPGKRGLFLLDRLAAVGQSRVRVRTLGGNRAGEMRITRFLRNPRVTPAEMVQTAAARTAKLVAGRHILAIQDTTSLRDDGDQQSLVLHPTIALDAQDGDAQDGPLLGLGPARLVPRPRG